MSAQGRPGKVVIVTGGSSGIGRCTAGVFAAQGWRVGLIARGVAGLEAAAADVAQAGGMARIALADVADCAALGAAADALIAELGPVDAWINCAGNGVYGRFADVPEEEFRRVTDVTYHGTVNGTRVALARMAPDRPGVIVNVCSAMVFHGLPLMTSYAGAKAAVRAFGQALRGELHLAGSRIRVSTVFPPATNTPFFSHAVSHMGWPARPAPPVYRPAVVARGIYRAALSGQPEIVISFTVAGFAWLSRLAPGLTAFLTNRLGFEGQLSHDPAVCDLHEPTLFVPGARIFSVDGPFGDRARGWSSQQWLASAWSGLLGWFSRRSAARSRPTHEPAAPDPVPAGWASPGDLPSGRRH